MVWEVGFSPYTLFVTAISLTGERETAKTAITSYP
jgi:hypothetical protein